MSVRDLIDKSSKFYMESSHAPTVQVDYYRASDDTTINNLNALIEENIFEDKLKDDKRANEINVLIYLEQFPSKLDKIIYNGLEYQVRGYAFMRTAGKYSIDAENKKRNKVSTRSRK